MDSCSSSVNEFTVRPQHMNFHPRLEAPSGSSFRRKQSEAAVNTLTETDMGHWLARYTEQNFNIAITDDAMSLAELGIDSVESVGMVCALEQWLGCKVPSDFLADVENIGALKRKAMAVQRQSTAVPEGESDYAAFINPFLAAKLRQLKIDRSFVRGEGCHLYDADGERYIDFMAQYGALPFGHHPRPIWDAMMGLRDDGEPNFAQPSLLKSAGQLARRLVEIAPAGLTHVTFANSGAEAVEAALKMARHATGRKGILSTLMGFHGKTFGALSATGKADYQRHFALPLPGFEHIEYGNLAALSDKLAAEPEQFAAFIVEPIQGEGGVTVPPEGYLRQAKEICSRHGVLFIVDEVQTGLGRTGALFACEAEGVVPDILTLAKALSGGLVPIGACLCTSQVYSEKFAMKHSSTFAGNALAARAGLATLEWLTRDDGALLKQVKLHGDRLRAGLEALQRKYPGLVSQVCGRGFMLGLRFSAERVRHENFLSIAAHEKELAQFVSSYLLNVERVRLAPTLNRGEVLRIQPPLNAPWDLCEQVLAALDRTLAIVATGQTGAFYRALLKRQAPEAATVAAILPLDAAPQPVAPGTAALAADGESRFAFLMHPLDAQSYADYDPSLGGLDGAELAEFATSMDGLLEPVIGSTVSITSASGERTVGDFIMVPHTAEQMRALSQKDSVDVVRRALALAVRRGARIVGLGAYTSVVTGGGAHVADCGVPVTSGNSYTVAASLRAIEEAVECSGQRWGDMPAAVVGAAGAIGSCMAALLATKVPRLILVGNPAHPARQGRERLLEVVRRVRQHVLDRNEGGAPFAAGSLASEIVREAELPEEQALAALERSGRLVLTAHPAAVGFARLVVMATSFPGKIVDEDVFQRGSIVCDVSRPRSVDKSILARRPDVLVIDGGVISVPGRPDIGPYGLNEGTAYACMAETMLLALDRHFANTSLGTSLCLGEVQRQTALAATHGFDIAELQSFGRPLTDSRWETYLRESTARPSSLHKKAMA
jgi:acetylornithine/succinyldiaminopimelate/putrescine aminotransferase/predicted amino acid dehydrogenase/acyl carrier protein